MVEKYENSFDYKRLREKAEKLVVTRTDALPKVPASQQEMLQDFQIHQMELLIQNEELKHTQQELETMLAKYVGVYYDHSPYGYITLSVKGIIQKLNLTAVTLLGAERVNIQYLAFSNYITPPCQMSYFLALNKAAKTLKKQSIELELTPHHDQGSKWVLAYILPDTDENDQCYQYRIAFLDITQYRHAKTRYQQMERMYGNLFSNLPLACHFMNKNLEIIQSNRLWETMTGYVADTVRNTSFLKYVHPDWREPFKLNFTDSISHTVTRYFSLALVHREGNSLDVEAILHPCAGNKEQTCACCYLFEKPAVHQDPTDEQTAIAPPFFAEEDLPVNFMQLDTDGRIVYASKACHKALGAQPDSLTGRLQWDLASNPNEARRIQEWFHYIRAHHPRPEPFQLEFKQPGQKPTRFQVDWHYQHDNTKNRMGFLMHLTDISTIKQVGYPVVHALMKKNEHLFKLSKDLENSNRLKNLLLANEQNRKKSLEKGLFSSIENLVLPYLEEIKNTRLTTLQTDLVEIVTSNLHGILDPFSDTVSQMDKNLTPAEIKVADLIKKGKTNKEIAQLLSISIRTVGFHRERLRKKFDIVHQKINLRSLLLSLDTESEHS